MIIWIIGGIIAIIVGAQQYFLYKWRQWVGLDAEWTRELEREH